MRSAVETSGEFGPPTLEGLRNDFDDEANDDLGNLFRSAKVDFMANATIQFHVEGIDDIRQTFRELSAQFARMKAIRRERRAYLNMLRSTRRTRKAMVRKWQLAKLHVKAAEIRVQCPKAEVRIASRNLRRGEPVVFVDVKPIEIVVAEGRTDPLTSDRRVLLLGRSPPIEILREPNG